MVSAPQTNISHAAPTRQVPQQLVEELLETAQDLGIQGLAGEEPSFPEPLEGLQPLENLLQTPENKLEPRGHPLHTPENLLEPPGDPLKDTILRAEDLLTVDNIQDKMTEENVMELFTKSTKKIETNFEVKKSHKKKNNMKTENHNIPFQLKVINPSESRQIETKAIEPPKEKSKHQCQVCSLKFVKLVREEGGSSVRGSRFTEQEVQEHMESHRPLVLSKTNMSGAGSMIQTKQEKPFLCPHCKNGYNDEESLNNHLKEVHEKKQEFMCQFCTRAFEQKVNMETHMKNMHFEAWAKWKVSLMTSRKTFPK